MQNRWKGLLGGEAGNPLPSNQLLAGWLCSGPGVVDPGCSLRGRARVAAWLQTLPAATCALACFAAWSFRLWYVPQAFCPREFYSSHVQKLAGTFLSSNLRKKSIPLVSPDFPEMALRLFLARIFAILCKYHYSDWS